MAGIQAYRNLIRSAQIAFKGMPLGLKESADNAGDAPILAAARQEIRKNFDSARHLSPDEQDIKLEHAKEVAKILRTNVVQGKRKAETASEEGADTYNLRIHKDIELGDNESIKKGKSAQAAAVSQGGCKGQ
jgi:complex III assembly factor LYRM7